MKIRVLGCYGGELPGLKTSCFLLNDTIVLDAGALTSSLTLDEQSRIRAILVSHSHVDHIKDIGFFADNVFGLTDGPVRLVGTSSVLRILKEHFLNGRIWPDFTAIPNRRRPFYVPTPLTAMKSRKISGLTITAVPVNHTVDAVGFIISDGRGSIIYSGDTGPTELLWREANKLTSLRGVLIETSFPNSMVEFSTRVGHLSPCTLEAEIKKLSSHDVPFYIYHLKPQYTGVLKKEIRSIGHSRIRILSQGMTLSL